MGVTSTDSSRKSRADAGERRARGSGGEGEESDKGVEPYGCSKTQEYPTVQR